METLFNVAHARVSELIDRFQAHAATYSLSTYQEAEARKDFIDPLLKALGWDVDHEREHNPYEQEVKVERGVSVARSQKRADYAFYLAPNFHTVRFFVEAKKPSVDLARNADAHFQAWRYGYSASTPMAVLTDFEEIHVLDCRLRPHPEAALDQIYKRWRYTDFRDPARFAELYWLFSREAHADGSFQRRVDEMPKPSAGVRQRGLFKGGYQPVDASFLAELEEHRSALAHAFKKADTTLDSETLTEIVQRTLDRLVFLRFLEDKQIEIDIRLSDFGKGHSAWTDFLAASRRLNNIYNGIVFKRLAPLDDAEFQVDNAVFSDICEQLASENSPYNFDAIPIHILGSIYERFLGSVIRATDKRVFVEEKPEVRKAGGVYYTPEYIVRYVVDKTVGTMVVNKSPTEIAKLRFVDIACGSGSFLLGVFDTLLRVHADWYNRPEHEKHAKKAGCVRTDEGRWRLSLAQRRAILLNNIYGVDIDRQAVEVAQLSLFLKLLEEERATSARQYQLDYARDASLKRLLPDLGNNIACGNSLISWKIAAPGTLSPEDEYRLNPLDFEQAFPDVMRGGGFDVILGNPPYVRIQIFKEAHPLAAAMLKDTYESASKGNFDIYVVFIERGLSLLNANGRLGFIVPHKFFNAKYGEALRGSIGRGNHLDAIVHFGDGQVFVGATTYTCLLFLAKESQPSFLFSRVSDLPRWQMNFRADDARLSHEKVTSAEWNFMAGGGASIVDRLQSGFPNLEAATEIFVGVQTSADDVFILQGDDLDGPLLTLRSKRLGEEVVLERALLHPLLSGTDVEGYGVLPARQFLIFPYLIERDRARLLPFGTLMEHFPNVADYLSRNRERLESRESGRMKGPDWYGYIYLKNMARQGIPKVVVPRLITDLCAAFDATGSHYLDNVDVGGVVYRAQNTRHDLRYLVALLNSRLLRWIFPNISAPFRGGFMSANRQFLGQLPFRPIDFSSEADVNRHDSLVSLVDQMLEAKKAGAIGGERAKELAARKCAALGRQIDLLVYGLYDLAVEEITRVEETSE